MTKPCLSCAEFKEHLVPRGVPIKHFIEPYKEEESCDFSHSALEKWINEQRNKIKIHRKRFDCFGTDRRGG